MSVILEQTMFVLREATTQDEDAILELAAYLNTLNLPPEREVIQKLLARSEQSFAGAPDFDPRRRFLFVLQAPDGRVVGTSMIYAQHGTFEEPHVFFRVIKEERYARLPSAPGVTRDVHKVHTMLHLGRTYNGPSEICGLVLDPSLRSHPQKLGRLLSLGRFVFLATHRSWFRERLLAEMLPPLYKGPNGATRSPLWDALGSRFTGLDYEDADRLSMRDKEFIWNLFPALPVHTSLLPEGVQDIIGQVGEPTRGAERMLKRIGFADSGHVDPFDGGPHLEAGTDQVTIVRDTQACRPEIGEPFPDSPWGIVAKVSQTRPFFHAIWIPVTLTPASDPTSGERPTVRVTPEHLQHLGALRNDGLPDPDARLFAAQYS